MCFLFTAAYYVVHKSSDCCVLSMYVYVCWAQRVCIVSNSRCYYSVPTIRPAKHVFVCVVCRYNKTKGLAHECESQQRQKIRHARRHSKREKATKWRRNETERRKPPYRKKKWNSLFFHSFMFISGFNVRLLCGESLVRSRAASHH